MKKQIPLFFIITIFITTLFVSCTKHAGTGGKAIINVHIINGNTNVPNADVYVNYNGNSFPGINATGDASLLADQKGLALFEDLKRGSYYFFVNTLINDTIRSGGAHVLIESRKGEQHIVIDLDEEDPF